MCLSVDILSHAPVLRMECDETRAICLNVIAYAMSPPESVILIAAAIPIALQTR